MKKCLKCNENIPYQITIEGKEHLLRQRKFCLTCSPFKSRSRKPLDKNRICSMCGDAFVGGHGHHKERCGKCRTLFYRNKTKQQAVEYKGGKCSVCGYDKCLGALHFHHVNPNDKKFTIAFAFSRKFESIVEELEKCILVCSNCHSEIHAGLINAEDIYESQKDNLYKYVPISKPEKFKTPVIKISKRPDKETLEKLVWEMSCIKIGEMFGVSDNAVNKWCKFYDIQKPGRGDWEKIKFGKLDKPEL